MAQDTLTLAELLKAPSQSAIMTKLLSSLSGANFPITDWESGGVERTMVELEADALSDLIGAGIPAIVGGGFLDYATGDWLTFLANQLYELDRGAATFTQETVVLTSAVGSGPQTFNPGQLEFVAASGNVYFGPTITDDDPGPTWTLSDGGTLSITVQSEHPNDSLAGLNYVDGAGTITTMRTQFAGVTCNNPAPVFTGVSLVGAGAGTITPSETVANVVPTAHSFDIQIVTSGQVGVGTFRYRVDGGSFGSTVPIATTALPGGTTITFANSAANPSFIGDDVYSFSTPGSPITQQGVDEESDDSLRGRCRGRWPSLSLNATDDKHEIWAKAASSQVTRVAVAPDDTVAGGIDITIAGPAGPLGDDVVNAVQSYIDAREGIGYLGFVSSASGQAITCLGTVTVAASLVAAVQAEAQTLWQTSVNSTSLGGVVRVATLEQILMNAGCTDVSGLTLNGGGNVTLTPTQVATFSQVLAAVLTWNTI